MSENWFYRAFGEEFGPVSLIDLREFAGNGTLSGDDEVRPEALTIWVPAKAVRELQDLYQETVESASTVTNLMNAAAASPAATDEWYYRFIDKPDTEVGPLPFDGIIELAKSGRLMADDEVRLGVDSKWRRAGSMGRLVAVLPYQTRRRNPAPIPKEETLEVAPPTDAVQDLLDSLPDEEPVDETSSERETPRPKSRETSVAKKVESTERKTPTPKSKARRVDPKHANKAANAAAAANESADEVSAELQQDIEDQILEELMTPSPKAIAEAPASMPTASPVSPPPVTSVPQDSWATTPHVASAASASFNRPTPTPIARPAVKAFKPVRSGPSFAEHFKNPNVWKGLAALVVLGLLVGWMNSSPGKGADIARYRELDALMAELRELREKDKEGKKFIPFKDKFLQTAKRIQQEVEPTAGADFPARQRILWATKNLMPEMSNSLVLETPAEKQVLANLEQAAIALGLKEAPKVQIVSSDTPAD